MPDWFTDTYIGVEVGQWIGLGVLIVVAGLAHFLINQSIKLYLRGRAGKVDPEFWERERGRLGRAITALVVAMTARLGFPALGFHDNGREHRRAVGEFSHRRGAAAGGPPYRRHLHRRAPEARGHDGEPGWTTRSCPWRARS